MPEADRGRVLRRIVEVAQQRAAEAYGEEKSYRVSAAHGAQIRLATWLIDNDQAQASQAALAEIPKHQTTQLEIRIAAVTKNLDSLLETYRREPEKAPPLDVIREAAAQLRQHGDAASARRVLEFVYTQALEQRDLNAGNFLGLAEIRLETSDVAAAQALLRRMTLVSGPPFENLEAAASLLEKFNRHAEAVEFREARVRTTPWDAGARVDLATARWKAGENRGEAVKVLAAIASEREASYETRASAALALREARGGPLQTGSAELDLLAESGPIAPARAAHPYFYFARVTAAGLTNDMAARVRLLTDAIAVDPVGRTPWSAGDPPVAPSALEASSRPGGRLRTGGSAPRLALFEAALAAKRYRTAVSAMEPLIESSGLRWVMQSAESSPQPPTAYSWLGSQFLNQAALDTPQRAAVARGLGSAFENLDRINTATLFYGIALQLEKSDAVRADLARLKAAAERRAQNAQRRPKVSEKLEQPDWVLPRLEGRVP